MNCSSPGCERIFNLINFPETYCWRHTPDDKRALLAELDRRGRAVGITPPEWPYGPNINAVSRGHMLDWAESHKLRHAPKARCLHWIAAGRCTARGFCLEDLNTYRWMDHVTGWNRDGKAAVLIAQPYQLGSEDLRQLADLPKRYDVRVYVGIGWYGAGTVSIEIWAGTRDA